MKVNRTLNRVMRAGRQTQRLMERAQKKADAGFIISVAILMILTILVFCVSGAHADQFTSGTAMTKHFEGYRTELYSDAGTFSIGYGFNTRDKLVRRVLPEAVVSGRRPITRVEADRAFRILYDRARKDAVAFVGPDAFGRLDRTRQNILIDMAYNLGARLSGFKRFRAALIAGDHRTAAREMEDSLWFRQTGRRARHHVKAMVGA